MLLKPYGEYYAEYAEKVSRAARAVPARGRRSSGEAAQKEFIALFGAILRLQNILTSFDDFAGNEILTERQSQDYRSVYLDLYAEFRQDSDADKESINDDVVFEIELIKQVEINVDYILMLVQKYARGPRRRRGQGDPRATIQRAVDASPTLRNKKDLIEDFVDSRLGHRRDRRGVAAPTSQREREAELDAIIEDEKPQARRDPGVHRHGLPRRRDPDDRHRDHQDPAARVSRSRPTVATARRSSACSTKLGAFFERFFGLSSDRD